MINYGTEFSKGQKVRIKYGLYGGRIGKIDNYLNWVNTGIGTDAENRGIPVPDGMLSVRLAWWHLNTVYCNPTDLEAVSDDR